MGEAEKTPSPAVLYGWINLGAAILLQSYLDILDGERELALEALYWLAYSEDAELFCELLDLPGDPLRPVGRLEERKLKRFGRIA